VVLQSWGAGPPEVVREAVILIGGTAKSVDTPNGTKIKEKEKRTG